MKQAYRKHHWMWIERSNMETKKLVGTEVTHLKYGAGVIENFVDHRIIICFSDDSKRTFIYPDAFENFLNTENKELTKEINKDIEGRQQDQDYMGRTRIVSGYNKAREFAQMKQRKQELKDQEQIEKRRNQIKMSEKRMQKREEMNAAAKAEAEGKVQSETQVQPEAQAQQA